MVTKAKRTEVKELQEFEVIESKAYIVHAYNEEDALKRFNNYDIWSEGDFWPTVRKLGPTEYVEEIDHY